MNNEVIILTEAGKTFGYGHLTRCLAIAQGFKEMGINSLFYLRGDSSPDQILKEFDWHHVDWIKESIDVSQKAVIVDSYYADEELCRKIYKSASKTLFIDDYNRISYPGGFVLNSVLGAENIEYPENSKIIYLLGPKFHPIRKEFINAPEKKIRKNIQKILITFGGSDISGETPKILEILNKHYPEVQKHVIIGNGFSNIEIIKIAADDKTTLIFQPDATRMKDEMIDCDIAISAAGQTIYELAMLGVPSIGICIVKNQLYNVSVWKKTKTFFFLNLIDNKRDLLYIPSMIKTLQNYNLRKKISKKTKKIIDSESTRRICKLLQP